MVASLPYPPRTLRRALRAMGCSRFCLPFFQAMERQSVPLLATVAEGGYRQGYTRRPLSEAAAEMDLLWLIQVGVLRREVDGQGITDSFRLTPLGSVLVAQMEAQITASPGASQGSRSGPSWGDRLYNSVYRWVKLTF